MNLHDPAYNRELIVKELALLERHLNIPEERCMEDCIPMHLLRAEAFAEEAVRMGGGRDFEEYAQQVRQLRKRIMGISQSHSNPEGKTEPYIEYGETTWVEHFEHPACEPRSHRTLIPNPEHRLTICCPEGEYDPETQRCRVGTVKVKLEHLHPPEESSSCSVCGGE